MLGTSNKDDKINPDKPSIPEDSKSLSNTGENMEHDVMAGEHWIYRGKRNALVLGESLAGKVHDVMSLSAVGITASKEAAGTLAGKVNDMMSQSAVGLAASKEAAGTLVAGIKSKTYGLWTSNTGFKKDEDKLSAPEDDIDTNVGETGQHWITRRKLLLYGGAAATGVAAVASVPFVLGAAGFGATGIIPGSLGAGMMSKAAATGVGTTVVSSLQSAAAAGLAGTTKVLIGGSVAGGVLKAAEKLGGKEGGGDVDPLPPVPSAASNTTTAFTGESGAGTTNRDKIPLSRL